MMIAIKLAEVDDVFCGTAAAGELLLEKDGDGRDFDGGATLPSCDCWLEMGEILEVLF